MINLLPPDLKQSYYYAHRNVKLIRWVVAFAVGLIGLMAISTSGLVYMYQSDQSYLTQISITNASLQKQNLTGTEAQVQSISNNLRLAVKVLSQEILFSKLLQQLAVLMPNNTILTNLEITKVQGGVDITAQATDYTTASQVQVNLADPANKIFSSADIESINCNSNASSSTDPTTAQYPCTVVIRALFAKNNPFLFINSTGK